MLCVDWLVSIAYCIFWDLIGFDKLCYFFLNWTVCLFLEENPIRNYPNLSFIDIFKKLKNNSYADNCGLTTSYIKLEQKIPSYFDCVRATKKHNSN